MHVCVCVCTYRVAGVAHQSAALPPGDDRLRSAAHHLALQAVALAGGQRLVVALHLHPQRAHCACGSGGLGVVTVSDDQVR